VVDAVIPEIDFEELAIRLAGYFAWRGGAPADVDDLVQETLTRLLEAIDSRWDPERGSVIQFAFGIARRVLFEHRRRESRLVPLSRAPERTVEPRVPSMLLRRAREAARGDLLVSLLLDRETGPEDRIALVWRAYDPAPREIYNAQRRLARLLRKTAAGEDP
jgi:DNA-directed RNA polymerase specialized sigma24 family protein